MRRSTTLHATVLAALAVGTLLLGGCSATPPSDPADSNQASSDPETDQGNEVQPLTCDEFIAAVEESLPLTFVLFDTDGTAPEAADSFRTLSEMWGAVVPPEPIADDWAVWSTWADDYASAWEALPADLDIQEGTLQLEQEFEEANAAYDTAEENITAYVEENCPQD